MKLIIRMLSLSLALTLPLCALAEDSSRRWVEDITKMKALPLADTARLDADFARQPIRHSGDVATAALAWANADILCGGMHQAPSGDLSVFVMQDSASWLVTVSGSSGTVVLELDEQGRLLARRGQEDAIDSYDGELPQGTDEAVLSYITHFARMNGCEAVTGYERLSVQWDGRGYDVRVTAAALLDGTRCTFTLSLETMAFTAIDCPLPAAFVAPAELQAAMTTPVPDQADAFRITLGGEAVTVRAIDRRAQGDAFSAWPQDAMPREEVFAIALEALMAEFGLTLEDVTAAPFTYGYDAESAMHRWQLNFDVQSCPMDGYDYAVYIRDCDGAVLGVWGPDEANG